MAAKDDPDFAYFVLSAWCTKSKCWVDETPHFSSPSEAEAAVIDRGIYRVVYVRQGRRIALNSFAWLGRGDDD